MRERPIALWFVAMALGGIAFGLFADRRPFGDDVLAHPFVLYFLLVGIGLLILRAAARRPVPELVPERALLLGCLLGAAAFLAGNWIGVHLLHLRP